MQLKYILILLFIIAFSATLSAQVDDDKSYQAFKVEGGKGADAMGSELITITVLPLGNGVNYFRNEQDNLPLTGTYRFVINNRNYVIGSIVKGVALGDWEEYSYDKLRKKSTYKNGHPDGKIQLYEDYYTRGSHYAEYTVKAGITQHYISYYKNGQLQEERFYDEKGKLHGNVKAYDENGNIKKDITYIHGNLDGIKKEVNNEGYTESTTYVKGRKNGEYRRLYPNGNTYEEGAYDAAEKKTGTWKKGEENCDTKLEENYLEGKLNGTKREFFARNILKSEEEYINGKRNGAVVYYEENPHVKTSEGNFVNDKRHGTFKVYHNGILWRETIYNEGREVGKKEYRDGKLQVVKLLDETGLLVDVEKYDAGGKKVYKNQNYKHHRSIKLKENTSGVIDIEF